MSQCLTSSSCASLKTLSLNCATYSLRLLRTSPEELLREGIGSCNKKIPILGGTTTRNKTVRELTASILMITLTTRWRLVLELKTNLRTSLLTKNLKTSRVRRKI
jgi:hypothetical protein